MENDGLGKVLKNISFGIEKSMNNKLRADELSSTQSLVLVWLNEAENHELSIKIIEKNFGTAQSTTLGVINRLEQKGLISTYLTQQRTKNVKITDDGLSLVESIKEYISDTETELLVGFTLGEKILFMELLKRAENNISK